MFGEQTSAVLHRNIQSPPVELHEGNGELKPDQAQRDRADSVLTTRPLLMSSRHHQQGEWDSRLVVNWVEVFLEGVSFPPA